MTHITDNNICGRKSYSWKMYRQPENNNRVKNIKSHFEKLDNFNKHLDDKKNDNQKTRSDDESDSKTSRLTLQRQLSDPSKRSSCVKRTPAFRKDKFCNSRSRSSTEVTFANKVSLFEDCTNCDTPRPSDTSSDNGVLDTSVESASLKSYSISPKLESNSFLHSYLQNSQVTRTRNNRNAQQNSTAQNWKINDLISDKNDNFYTENDFKFNDRSIDRSPMNFSTKDESSPDSRNKNRNKNSSRLLENLKQLADQYKDENLWEISQPNDFPQNSKDSAQEDRSSENATNSPDSNKVKKYSENLNVKIRSKSNQNRSEFANTRKTTVSFIKEMIENQANSEFESKLHEENLEIKRIPEYARVDKSTKKNATERNRQSESLTDTLKAALKRPLPTGPPPKKPPRTFAHVIKSPNLPLPGESSGPSFEPAFKDKLNTVLSQEKPTKAKTDPKAIVAAKLQKLENALLNNKIRSPKLPKKIKSSLDAKNLFASTAPSNDYTTEPNLKTLFPNCLSGLNCANVREPYSESATLLANFSTSSKPEHIYAEPFEYQALPNESKGDDDVGTSTISRSVHYLSCPVPLHQSSVNVTYSNEQPKQEVFQDHGLNKQKLKLIMNNTYASIHAQSDSDDVDSTASTPTLENTSTKKDIRELIKLYEDKKKTQNRRGDSPNKTTTMIEETKKIKVDLTRSLTEIRKTYVKRVCSTVRRKRDKDTETSRLFECCLLVELNISTLQPYIKGKYPPEFQVPPWVEHLCYPDLTEWSPETLSNGAATNLSCQCFSLVITNEKGDRKFGYCRRVLPEGATFCLPLTYCIISSHRAPGFYFKILEELESRHGSPGWLQNTFLGQLYNSNFPKPGQHVEIPCLLQTLLQKKLIRCDLSSNTTDDNKRSACEAVDNELYNRGIQKNIIEAVSELDLNKDDSAKIDDFVKNIQIMSTRNSHRTQDSRDVPDNVRVNVNDLLKLVVDAPPHQDCLSTSVVFKRPYDHRTEETDLTVIFDTLKLEVLLQIFGSLLLERKVILIGKCLSRLSLCVEAMQSILYPFSWQHTFIPVLSDAMLDVLSAPLPLVTGVLASHIDDRISVEDGIVVDLDKSEILCSVGDENRILPKKLRNSLLQTLHLLATSQSDDDVKNVLVSEAFLRMFVEVCGHYGSYVVSSGGKEATFDKEGFVRHLESKSMQLFLEWFTETAMFQAFVQQRSEGASPRGDLFQERCSEVLNDKHTTKNSAMQKMRNLFR